MDDVNELSGKGLGMVCAVEIMGWQDEYHRGPAGSWHPYFTTPPNGLFVTMARGEAPRLWHPWEDLRAAGEVLDAMTADGWHYSMSDQKGRHYCAFMKPGIGYNNGADNLPTAICRAALAAMRGTR